MKRILIVAFISILFTGCASNPSEGSYGKMIALGFVSPELAGEEAIKLGLAKRPKDPIEQATETCRQVGYQLNTDAFRQCVVITSNNIRSTRAQQKAAETQAAEIRKINQSNFMNSLEQAPRQPIDQSYRNYDCRSRLGGRVECTGY